MNQSKKINTALSKILYFSIAFLFLIIFALPASVAAITGASSRSDILDELCGPASSSQNIACRDNVSAALDGCDEAHQPNTQGNVSWRECRQGVIEAEGRPTGSSSPTTEQGESGGVILDEEFNTGSGFDEDADCRNGLDPDSCGIVRIILQITDGLLVIVGIVVVMMIVVGGIQYSAAGSNPQAVAAAKKKISQALFALVIYLFMGAFLQWLIPGGLF